MVPNAILYNSLSVGRKTTKIAPSPWDFVTLPDCDRATAIGNMHRKIGKDRVCGSGDILMDRQTDTQTQTCSSHYFSTASAGQSKKLRICFKFKKSLEILAITTS